MSNPKPWMISPLVTTVSQLSLILYNPIMSLEAVDVRQTDEDSTGWLIASFLNIYLQSHLHFWKTLVIAAMTNIVGSTIIITLPPFSVFVVALFINGIGACIYNASFATYTAYFDEGPAMSLLFAAFGVHFYLFPLIPSLNLRAWVRLVHSLHH
ncbi:hypothetical protein F5890DRAFT_1560102 [Lentinula detonsa]|uniref:Uncharacterized protein n=1 Tax=Lentinula detonsa TaxID=2804962 RepID=A0AA38PNV8_9AGAR|nr:hypothetical protein F5890DRAFT_1560102 [Lentinula detonsa]